jgi:hypothetical protein
MAEHRFLVKQSDLKKLEADVYNKGHIDREHLVVFLEMIPTNDGKAIVEEVRAWLQKLQDDPKYDKITFPRGDIEAVLGDLDSYGRVQPDTIAALKEQSNRSLPIQ